MFDETKYVDARNRYEREKSAGGLIVLESLLVAMMVLGYFQSWRASLLVFLGLLFFGWIRPISIIFSITFSICWTLVGFLLGISVFNSNIVAIIFAIVAFIISLRLHFEVFRIT
ncbi:hypothetical protein M662_19205 [Bacillus sp. SB49]|uniref:hypothetical protein n=1 Tax=Bacillaceae TaxID=186817 RepID=UPI0002A50B8B|nr:MULTISPECIES: hypothetical protein [Bacillaceae]ELK47857.1 hypothetical protein D479_05185 [Halobacillus sp. BAB-2008]QHT48521.1 hypothetical protein M662_19205 [Bacillus sp. SB49]